MITQNNGSMTALEAGLEAVLFAAGDAVTIERLSAALEVAPAELLDAAAALENRYDFENRGIMLLRIEDKLQLASRPMYGPYVRRVTESRRPPAHQQTAGAHSYRHGRCGADRHSARADCGALRNHCSVPGEYFRYAGLPCQRGRGLQC